MFIVNTKSYSIFGILIILIFGFQLIFQNIPISQSIIVNGEAVCTCGCGHTIEKCAANHSNSNHNCKCKHDRQVERKIHFSTNVIKDFVETPVYTPHLKSTTAMFYINKYCTPITVDMDIILPPPKLLFT